MCLHLCMREKGSESIAAAMWQTLYGVLECRSLTLTTHWRTCIFRSRVCLWVRHPVSVPLSHDRSLAARGLSMRLRGRGYWYSMGFCKVGESMGYYYSQCSYPPWPTHARMGAAAASHQEARELARDAWTCGMAEYERRKLARR